MERKIIKIDDEKCNGCGLCAAACHEGAIDIIAGKARLARENYCDGLGDCLPACPANAISFETREAPAYDEAAVLAARKKNQAMSGMTENAPRFLNKEIIQSTGPQWPVQLRLLPVTAPFFDGADLLVAADCAAYAYANFHEDFQAGHALAIGCPKLDDVDYADMLAAIISRNNIKSVTVARMNVPCCGGLEKAARRAVERSGKTLPVNVKTISTAGSVAASNMPHPVKKPGQASN